MARVSQIAVAVFCIGLLSVGALLVQVFRYEYMTASAQNELQHFVVRVDRLTGKVCFLPLSTVGEQVAPQILVIEQCP
jgi:hypothetical protein